MTIVVNSKPWAPIFSIARSDEQELLVEGILSFVAFKRDGTVRRVLGVGDDNHPIWTRSLLKPWQLLANLSTLQTAYEAIRPHHLALMTASHSADLEHLCLLRQLMDIGGIFEDALRCPPAMPKMAGLRSKLEQEGYKARPLFHNCSGKHLGYLLYIKANEIKTENYLDPAGAHYKPLVSILSRLTGRPENSFVPTVDGCRIPNYALTAFETATLYMRLAAAPFLSDANIGQLVDDLIFVGEIMNTFPNVIDGNETLDTDIMKGRFVKQNAEVKFVAKVGADGLLGVGFSPHVRYPYGSGLLIKLAHGYSERHCQLIFAELMQQLSLSERIANDDKIDAPTRTHFFFQIID